MNGPDRLCLVADFDRALALPPGECRVGPERTVVGPNRRKPCIHQGMSG